MMDDPRQHGHPQGFDGLIDEIRSRLLPALVAKWGVEVGSDVCSEVEEYAWANQDRLVPAHLEHLAAAHPGRRQHDERGCAGGCP